MERAESHPHPAAHARRGAGGAPSQRGRAAGITLTEILIAMTIFGTALLSLGYYHTSAMIGVRRDGQITEANQLAVTIAEGWRDTLRKDGGSVRQYDDGATGTRTVAVDGIDYSGTYVITPQWINPSGVMIDVPLGQTPHLFQVEVTVAASDASDRTYSTLVFRTPDQ